MRSKEEVVVSAAVNAPIWRVYQKWRRLEEFPSFVPSVREARWLSKSKLYWCEKVIELDYEATFEIRTDLRKNSLSWQSLTGPESTGDARCEALPGGGSRVTLTVQFTPDTETQEPEVVHQRHLAYLRAFKKYVEADANA